MERLIIKPNYDTEEDACNWSKFDIYIDELAVLGAFEDHFFESLSDY